MGMRIIYLAIRAANYTDQATRQVGRNITKLMRQQRDLQRQMTRTFGAGLMYVAVATLITMGIKNIIATTREGRSAMRGFDRALQSVTKTLGKQFLVVLDPLIKSVTAFLNVISRNEPLLRFIAVLASGITAIIMMRGVTFLLSTAYNMLQLSLLSTTSVMDAFVLHGGYATTMMFTWAGAIQVVQASMAPMIMSFFIFLQIAERLGPLAKPILGVAAALMILAGAYIAVRAALGDLTAVANLGVMIAAAGAGMGLAAAVYTEAPSYQYGTRMVQRTGPAIVHAGDVISRPDRGDTTPQQERGFPKHYYNVTLSFGDVKTKADKEELRPLILKTLKDALNNKV